MYPPPILRRKASHRRAPDYAVGNSARTDGGRGGMAGIETKFLFTLKLRQVEYHSLGKTPYGERRIDSLAGEFEGPRLRGALRNSSSDWLLRRFDGSYAPDVRLTLETDDHHFIGVLYKGYRSGPQSVWDRLAKGETPDPSEYYMRMAAFFETEPGKYDWLNRIIAIASGHRFPHGPVYQFHEVL
ncbi:MAG: DUF3237 domain-containing protein [Alphaproteobacteria bacterium]|nr:DUF3237 domain-containing protein [Alphaproteobacteria bacterium]